MKSILTPEQILETHDPYIRDVADKLRGLIKSNLPDVVEGAYPGWHAIGYRHPRAGYICGIFPHSDKIDLAFEHGASFYDPDHLLKKPPTSSKQVRYFEVRTEEDIDQAVIADFLAQAVFVEGK